MLQALHLQNVTSHNTRNAHDIQNAFHVVFLGCSSRSHFIRLDLAGGKDAAVTFVLFSFNFVFLFSLPNNPPPDKKDTGFFFAQISKTAAIRNRFLKQQPGFQLKIEFSLYLSFNSCICFSWKNEVQQVCTGYMVGVYCPSSHWVNGKFGGIK